MKLVLEKPEESEYAVISLEEDGNGIAVMIEQPGKDSEYLLTITPSGAVLWPLNIYAKGFGVKEGKPIKVLKEGS